MKTRIQFNDPDGVIKRILDNIRQAHTLTTNSDALYFLLQKAYKAGLLDEYNVTEIKNVIDLRLFNIRSVQQARMLYTMENLKGRIMKMCASDMTIESIKKFINQQISMLETINDDEVQAQLPNLYKLNEHELKRIRQNFQNAIMSGAYKRFEIRKSNFIHLSMIDQQAEKLKKQIQYEQDTDKQTD